MVYFPTETEVSGPELITKTSCYTNNLGNTTAQVMGQLHRLSSNRRWPWHAV